MTDTFYAHSGNVNGYWEPVQEHLTRVAELARSFASPFGAADEATLAGLLHDLGKYGDLFQRRLHGQEKGLDHWWAGAWEALMGPHAIGAALAIMGHHTGLPHFSKDALRNWMPERYAVHHPSGRRVTDADIPRLLSRMAEDGMKVTGSGGAWMLSGVPGSGQAAAMLDVRMLFSALVDADFLATEAHFSPNPGREDGLRDPGPDLNPGKALALVQEYIATLEARKGQDERVAAMRRDLHHMCLSAAEEQTGLYTLTAPTGSGKTMAMLAFALKHALQHGLRRIVIVIPYLTIIEQTAKEYRDILEPHFGPGYVLEHHSLAGTGKRGAEKHGEESPEGDDDDRRKLQAQNWDAPLVITTSVQILESLFANRPSACRKLHRLAKSVVLFDEAQALPVRLAVPTLAALGRLTEARYGSTVVFATATQPAFTHLDAPVAKMRGPDGWRPTEIVPVHLGLSERARRTEVVWPEANTPTKWETLAEDLAEAQRGLCVVNLKRHAHRLVELLAKRGSKGLFHLSTSMCPAHRQDVLTQVRELLLQPDAPCLLISTQCVEAGVDVDFPAVWRAFGPLDSIAQAAGRCNRHGKMAELGKVTVFIPEEEKYPPGGGYEQAAAVARSMLASRGASGMDIHDAELFREYYRKLYGLTQPEIQAHELQEAVLRLDFPAAAKEYRIIPDGSISVLVPYRAAEYARLVAETEGGVGGEWMRKAQYDAVSIYRPSEGEPVWTYMDPVPLHREQAADDWFIYREASHYNTEHHLGLLPPQAPALWCV